MPNLISLEMHLGSSNVDEDLSWLLRANPALRRLHLHLSEDLVRLSAGRGGVLRHGLQREALPARLAEVVLEGEELADMHPAAFKVGKGSY